MPASNPHVFAIGVQSIYHQMLRGEGFIVSTTSTLLEGYTQLAQRLATSNISRTPLIMIDLRAHEPGFPELAAPQLIAVLDAQIRCNELHPAWLIGLTSELTSLLTVEANIAGCHQILSIPFDDLVLSYLRDLATQAAPLPKQDIHDTVGHARQAYQVAAQRVFDAVRAARTYLWTVEDVYLVLGSLTRYPLAEQVVNQLHDAQAQRALRALGGSRTAKQRLFAIAEGWRERLPLHSEILQRFLEGWERREIVASFVARDLYDDSRVYFCIKELPERLVTELRLMAWA